MRHLSLLIAAAVFLAGCASYDDRPVAAGVRPYPGNTCIVSGDKFDHGKPVVKVVNGQQVKFCCDDCVKDFEKDPAKYLTKLTAK